MYATLEQMTVLFGEEALVLLTCGDGAIDEAKLAGAIRAAQAEVDGYLAGKLALPLAEDQVPDALRLHACNIAYWYLDTDNPTEGAKDRYRAAVRFLERVQDGKAGLGVATSGSQAQPVEPASGVAIDAPGRVFTDDRLRGYVG